ncbi:retrotransposon protein, putative, ty1-copia subclass [Tanacetum coccineum]|uniref:Retrotransposon protein, putative, ty1-copia subclass n=1 Tax=Tanacetum coccineum TaxID=301880 RepID=A0ABQ5F882_9ASTR
MAAAAQNTNNTTIRSILIGEKLTGSNFTNWYRNLRIFLRYEKKLKFVEQPIGPKPDLETTNLDTIDKYYKTANLEQEVACIMLSSMSPDLQRTLEKYNAYDMMQELKTMFEEHAKQELFETVKAFHACYEMPNELGTIAELHAMLKVHEKGILKKAETLAVLAIREGKIQKDKKKPRGAKEVEAIGSFDLILPSGLIIILDNCYFAPTVTRGVVLISRLVKNGYTHTFTNYGISVSKDNVFYFNAIPRAVIYEIDMHNMHLNVSLMFNVSNKRAKLALDSSYLWHCRLGHINKKRIDKLQRDGILQPTHDESLEKCKSCISRKMASKPFPHQVERADLLGLIHTDVCGPFRIVSREGASYFITFTDDFNRYGYVYLMKQKHEVFETFKVFQNEVENQLGKKIKAIRSDRGGEYLSHEFVNHMKSCGIVSQHTPPYTPQHNKVSERRNQTLLDMVRSMMNLTNLPKSFWGYALESAARILNMNRAYRLLHPENSARINGNNSRHISMRMHLSHNGPVRRINETVSLCATDTNAQVVPPGTICVHSNELLKMTPSDRKEKVTHPMLCGAVSILELSKVDIPKNFAQKMVVIEAGVGFMPCKMNFTNLIRLEVWELVPSLNAMLWSIALKGIYKVKALQLKELSSTRWMSKNAFLNGDLLRRSLFSQSPEASLLTNAKYALFEILRNMEWILALTPVDTPMVDRLETGTRISWVFPVDQNSIQRNGWLRLCTLQPVDDLVFAVWHVCMLQDAVSCRDVLRIYKKIVRRGGLSVFFSGDKIAREIEWLLNLLTSFGKMEREFIAECLPDISHQLALPRESVSNFLSSSHSMKSLTPETLRRLQEGEVQQLESNVLGG